MIWSNSNKVNAVYHRDTDTIELNIIRIIAMSANTFSDDVHAALESGMNAHVGKPIDMDVLADVLSAVL